REEQVCVPAEGLAPVRAIVVAVAVHGVAAVVAALALIALHVVDVLDALAGLAAGAAVPNVGVGVDRAAVVSRAAVLPSALALPEALLVFAFRDAICPTAREPALPAVVHVGRGVDAMAVAAGLAARTRAALAGADRGAHAANALERLRALAQGLC